MPHFSLYRPLPALTLACALMATTALAAPQTLTSHVSAVTVYPQAAEVTRDVTFTADAAGVVDLVIPDLPMDAMPDGMHFMASPGVTVGAFALRYDRVPPATDPDTPAVAAARSALTAAEDALRQVQAGRDAVLAKADAAEAQVAFLTGVRLDGATVTPEAVQVMAKTVGDQVLLAKQSALAARAEAAPFDAKFTDAQKAVDDATAALSALVAEPEQKAALTLSVTVDKAGPVTLQISHFVSDASWRPAYDMKLDDRATPATLTVDRGALVSKYTGEDWQGVAMTLSTARPSEQSAPTILYPYLRQITDPAAEGIAAKTAGGAMADDMMVTAPAPTIAPPMESMAADFSGIAVTYHLAAPASVASGVEDLRLGLDSLTFTPKIVAEAVPSRDATAFVVATWVNEGKEILLPGQAMVSRDGTLVGSAAIALLAPGDKAETGFGAIDGLKLTRGVPDRSTGDHGVFTTSTEQHETALLTVENLTDQSWPIRLLDQVPYSEQDDLKIEWTADPMPDETDIDAQRGILGWNFELAAGAKSEITLESTLSWPAGKVLQ